MPWPCSAAATILPSCTLAVRVSCGPSMADESSSYIEVGRFLNSHRMGRGASLTVGALMQRTSRCPGAEPKGARSPKSQRPTKPPGELRRGHDPRPSHPPLCRKCHGQFVGTELVTQDSFGLPSGRFDVAGRQNSSKLGGALQIRRALARARVAHEQSGPDNAHRTLLLGSRSARKLRFGRQPALRSILVNRIGEFAGQPREQLLPRQSRVFR
jgi:hypothetical protein